MYIFKKEICSYRLLKSKSLNLISHSKILSDSHSEVFKHEVVTYTYIIITYSILLWHLASHISYILSITI